MNEMASKLWDLANVITGFSIVQSLGVTFALTKCDLDRAMKTDDAHLFAYIGTGIFTIFYIVAIYACGSKARALIQEPKLLDVWKITTLGRIIAVILFTAITVLALYGHSKSATRAC